MSSVTRAQTSESPFRLGNTAMREGDTVNAIRHYLKAMEEAPGLGTSIAVNLAMARQKYRAERNSASKPRVAVCGWELSHKVAVRVYRLAMLYETIADVEIIGSHFPGWGRDIWEPIRDTTIAKHSFIVEEEAKFIDQAIQLVAAHPYDIVHLCSPRAPNIFFGILFKLVWDAQVIVDMHEDELAIVNAETAISPTTYLKQHGHPIAFDDLTGQDWTRIAVALVPEFDGLTVANAALQRRYGGEIVDHVQVPTFDPAQRNPAEHLSFAASRQSLQHVLNTADRLGPQLTPALRQIASGRAGQPFAVLQHLLDLPQRHVLPTVRGAVQQRGVTPLAAPEPSGKVAVAVHIYYPELWSEIAQRLTKLTHAFDLFITTPPERAVEVEANVRLQFPNARIQPTVNQGTDILPFLSLVPTWLEEDYLAVCKVHTKKGQRTGIGIELARHWSAFMLDSLVGNSHTFGQVVQAFTDHPRLCLAGVAAFHQSAQLLMYDNQPAIEALARGIESSALPQADWGFFAGTMFWARPTALARLAAYVKQADRSKDFKNKDQFAHAMERYFGLIPHLVGGKIGLLQPSFRSTPPDRSDRSASLQVVEALRLTSKQLIGQAHVSHVIRQASTLQDDVHFIGQTGLFDTKHYLGQCPALQQCQDIDLIQHYLLQGRFHGYTPHPDFDPPSYKTACHGVLQDGQDPFLHYARSGALPSDQPAVDHSRVSNAPNFRFRLLNTTLIDWDAEQEKQRDAQRISIIIPVCSQKDDTAACIESLYQHTQADRFELVVVDNGSDAQIRDSLQALARRHTNLTLTRSAENLSFALTCNLGFAASQGETVIFLHGDTTVTANWLEPLIEPLARPEISTVQPRSLDLDGRIQSIGVVFSDKNTLGYPIYAGRVPDEAWAGRSRAYRAVTGACMSVRAVDFAKAKGFDPVFVNGQEDVDLCLRLNLASHRSSWYAANSAVRSCWQPQSDDPGRFTQFNRAIFCRRWIGRVPADDQQHYLEDGFIVNRYQPDDFEQSRRANICEWRPDLTPIDKYELERPTSLPQYFFEQIKSSGLFDVAWYLRQYRGKMNIEGNPLEHYLAHGVPERLNPSAAFDTNYYVKSNPDVANSELHPFLHYVLQGGKEDRKPLPPAPLEYDAAIEPQHVPRLAADASEVRKTVRAIAFYLPQYHAIPENDEWWGKGFTEWSNVKPANPQFAGHYQPHIPGDLGYYDLLDGETQRKQIELAKLYGLEGFCFYFYWFGGKRLLETPTENYLNDPSLDFPFCLCWANENWSRRWDGLESEILMAQQYSPEDDMAFIAHVSKYMRDRRYIRIAGRPLLLLYRPSLLPDVRETTRRWRQWCRENGIGEIYLAYTQSFETLDPSLGGFDAAVEFPPNNTAPPNITDNIISLDRDFGGNVYDWKALVDRSENYKKPAYKLFRGVCPSWDNTARRGNKSSILLHSSPIDYQRWLVNAINDTKDRFRNPDERLIFINAWNEWAEGAYLEPNDRYGHAYLEATRMAQIRTALPAQARTEELAIIVHAFYEDVFEEIMEELKAIRGIAFKLFVTTPPDQSTSAEALLKASGFSYYLMSVENHGRDILPFLRIIQPVVEDGYAYILKIHTKKSKHRGDGDVWRDDLYSKLLNEQSVHSAMASFAEDANLGIIGPTGHIVSMDFYWGSNAKTVLELAARLGQAFTTVKELSFVAGTMFFARVDALLPLLGLAIRECDFEPEVGQVDGTFAHALERTISISARSKRYKLIDTDLNEVHQADPVYRFVSK